MWWLKDVPFEGGGSFFGSITCKTSLFYIAGIDITITQQRVDGFSKSFLKWKVVRQGCAFWGRRMIFWLAWFRSEPGNATIGTIRSNSFIIECVDGFLNFFVRVGGRDLGMCMGKFIVYFPFMIIFRLFSIRLFFISLFSYIWVF